MIRLRGLGDCSLHVGETRLSPGAETLFAATLYLTLEAGRVVSRREMFAVFWPGEGERLAAHRLRQMLYRLNLAGAAIQCERADVVLPRASVESDVHDLLGARDPARLEALADSTAGDLLPGYAPGFSAAFSEWLDEQRERVAFAMHRAYGAGVALKRARGDWHGAETLASRCLERDPWNEDATLALAESAAMKGSRIEALGVLDRYLRELDLDGGEVGQPAAMLRRRIAEALDADMAPPRKTPHIGRDEEVGLLSRALQRATTSGGGTYLVWGEIGMGKTRMTMELATLAALRDARVARTACQPHDARRPLSAFGDLVPQLLALPGALGCSPDGMKYLRRLVAHDPRVTTLSDETRDAEQLFANVRRSIFDLFDAVAGEVPLLVVIEDVHWLDGRSLSLVKEMAGWVGSRRIMLLLTSRVRDVMEPAPEGEAAAPCELHLAPLGHEACLELLRNLLRGTGRGADDGFLQWCASAAGGNPYYLTELALHGERDGDRYRAPASLEHLIETRLAHLGSLSRRALQACCSLGAHATFDRVERVLGVRAIDLMDSLEDLERRGLIDVDGARLVRRHELLTQAALARLTSASRTLLDRRVAQVLEEEMAAGGSAAVMWECAEHWQRAGEGGRATRLLRSCARHSLEVGLPLDAAQTLARALTLMPSDDERLELMADRVHALHLAAAWPELEVAITNTLHLRSQQEQPGPRHCDLELLLYQTRWRVAPTNTDLLRTALRCVRAEAASPEHRVRAGTWAMMLADNLCDVKRAALIYSTITPLLAAQDLPMVDKLYFGLVYHSAFGDPSYGAAAASELLAIASPMGDQAARVKLLAHAGFAFRCNNQINEAISAGRTAVEVAQRYGMSSFAAAASIQLSSLFLGGDDLQGAKEWHQRALSLLGSRPDAPTRAAILSNGAEIAAKGNALDLAEALMREAREVLNGSEGPRITARLKAFGWYLRILRGDAKPRTSELTELVRLHVRTRHATHQDLFAQVIFQLFALSGRRREGSEILREYVGRHRRVKWPLPAELRAILRSLDSPDSEAVDLSPSTKLASLAQRAVATQG